MQRASSSVIACVWIVAVLSQPLLDVVQVFVDDRLAEKLSVADVGHLSVIVGAQRVEAAYSLPSAIVFHERDWSSYVSLALFLCDLLLFYCNWCWAMATAILDDIVNEPEESRMTM